MNSLGSLTKAAGLCMLSLSTLGALSCTRVKTARTPDGAYSLACERGMGACVDQAAKLCADDGYTILGGMSSKHLLGGPSSSYRAAAEIAELTVICGIEGPEENREGIYELPERTDEPVATKVVAPVRACTPGATQKCVGPGACEGGQVCASDGSTFGACDCGSSSAAPAKESVDDSGSAADPGSGVKGEKVGKEAPKTPSSSRAPTPLK